MITLTYIKTLKFSGKKIDRKETFDSYNSLRNFYRHDIENAFISNVVITINKKNYFLIIPDMIFSSRDESDLLKSLERLNEKQKLYNQ